jgi:hypothetical protein
LEFAIGRFEHLFHGVLADIGAVNGIGGEHLHEKSIDLFRLEGLGAGGARFEHRDHAGGGDSEDEDGRRGDGEPTAADELTPAVEGGLRSGGDRAPFEVVFEIGGEFADGGVRREGWFSRAFSMMADKSPPRTRRRRSEERERSSAADWVTADAGRVGETSPASRCNSPTTDSGLPKGQAPVSSS